jgi:large subunit ribosomal protein L13
VEPSAKITKSFRNEDVQSEWWVVDAADYTVGRLSTQVATLLRGKHKVIFTPHVDTGDFVIIINADKVKLEGKRVEMKEYFKHSGYPGGVRIDKFKDLIISNPERIIEHSVKGMLPKTKLGKQIIKKLKVYRGAEHPHQAQMPKVYELKYK